MKNFDDFNTSIEYLKILCRIGLMKSKIIKIKKYCKIKTAIVFFFYFRNYLHMLFLHRTIRVAPSSIQIKMTAYFLLAMFCRMKKSFPQSEELLEPIL